MPPPTNKSKKLSTNTTSNISNNGHRNKPIEDKSIQTDEESAQFAQEIANLAVKSHETRNEMRNTTLIRRQSILTQHIRKLSQENSQLRVKLNDNNNSIKQMLNVFNIFRGNNADGLSFMKEELRAMTVYINSNEKRVQKEMRELRENYEREKKIFVDKLDGKDFRIGKYKSEIKKLAEIKKKIIAALEINQRNLQIARAESYNAYQKEKDAVKKLNDKLYLAGNERCINCKLVEEKREHFTDHIALELQNLKTDNEKKNLENVEKDKIISMLMEKMKKLEKAQKELEEEKKKAEYSAKTYLSQFQQSETKMKNLMKEIEGNPSGKYLQTSSTGTPTTEEEIMNIVSLLTPPDESNKTGEETANKPNENEQQLIRPKSTAQTAQKQLQNAAIKSNKRPLPKSIMAKEGEKSTRKSKKDEQMDKNYLKTGIGVKMGGESSKATGKQIATKTSAENKEKLSANQNQNESDWPNGKAKINKNAENGNNKTFGEDGTSSSLPGTIQSCSPKPKKQKSNNIRIGLQHLPGALSSQNQHTSRISSAPSNPLQTGIVNNQQNRVEPWRITPFFNPVQNFPQQQIRMPPSNGFSIPPTQSTANIYRRCSGATIDDFCNDVQLNGLETKGHHGSELNFSGNAIFARSNQIEAIPAGLQQNNFQGTWRGTPQIPPVVTQRYTSTIEWGNTGERINQIQQFDGQHVRSALPHIYEQQQIPVPQITIPRPPERQPVQIPTANMPPTAQRIPNVLPWHNQTPYPFPSAAPGNPPPIRRCY